MISTFSSNTELKRIYSWIVHCRFHVMLVLLLEVKEDYEILCYVRICKKKISRLDHIPL